MQKICVHCRRNYPIVPDNAQIIMYPNDPECNHVNLSCPLCLGKERIFLDAGLCAEYTNSIKPPVIIASPNDTIRQLARQVWAELRASDETSGSATDTSPGDVALLELTPRMEREIDRFAQNLEVIPDDLFYGLMEDPNPVRNPLHWC